MAVGLLAAFAKYNDGIVLGDRSNHVAIMHFPQVLYFTLFCFAFLPLDITQYLKYIQITLRRLTKSLGALTTFSILLILYYYLVHNYTYAHPFMLADNRHYIFYIWKNFYARFELFRYLMIVPYAFSSVLIFRIVASNSISEP
jgi:alpha-1,2-glucosyltransferase